MAFSFSKYWNTFMNFWGVGDGAYDLYNFNEASKRIDQVCDNLKNSPNSTLEQLEDVRKAYKNWTDSLLDIGADSISSVPVPLLDGMFADKGKAIDELTNPNELWQILNFYMPGKVERNLCLVSKTQFDQARANNFRPSDPFALDLDGDGKISTLGVHDGVLFDHDGDEIRTGTGWVSGNDGLLVWDKNGNGKIDDGNELFGDNTRLSTDFDWINTGSSQKAKSGFEALSYLIDSNHDGVLNAQDEHWSDLRVWRDIFSDGITQEGELFTLDELGITSISLKKNQSGQSLGNGNTEVATGTYTKSDGTIGKTADLGFDSNAFYSEFVEHIALSEEAKLLPNMAGIGVLRDLAEAATLSPKLLGILQRYASADILAQRGMIDALLDAWAETGKDLSQNRIEWSTSGGGINYVFEGIPRGTVASGVTDDAYQAMLKKLIILEEFNGQRFASAASGTFMIFRNAQGLINQAYDSLKNSIFDILASKAALKVYTDLMAFDENDEGISINYSAMIERLNQRMQNNSQVGFAEAIELYRQMGDFLSVTGFDLGSWIGGAVSEHPIDEVTRKFLAERGTLVGTGANDQITLSGAMYKVFSGAGNDTVNFSWQGNNIIDAGDGDDVIRMIDQNSGRANAAQHNEIRGGLGNDAIYSGSSEDIYYFNRGDGQDTIEDNSYVYSYATNGYYYAPPVGKDTILFGKGISKDDLCFSRQGNDLLVTIKDPKNDTISDSILVKEWNYFFRGEPIYRIEYFKFQEGSYLSMEDVNNLSTIGRYDSNDITLWSDSTFALGGSGDDTIRSDGWANREINTGSGDDKITISGSGKSLVDSGDGNDLISSTSSGDSILLSGSGNDTINFSYQGNNIIDAGDGDDVIRMIDHSSRLVNSVQHNEIRGGLGNDTIYSRASEDIYYFNRGDGRDTIEDNSCVYSYVSNGYYYASPIGQDTISFGEGISKENLRFVRKENDLLISITDMNSPDAADSILLKNWSHQYYGLSYYRIEHFKFADASLLSMTDINNLSMTGTEGNDNLTLWWDAKFASGGAGNDTIRATNNAEFLAGGAGDDVIHTGAGNDVIAYNAGDGFDILSLGGGNKTLSLGNIKLEDVSLYKSGNDLVLTTGEKDGKAEGITLQNWYLRGAYQSLKTLQFINPKDVAAALAAPLNAGQSEGQTQSSTAFNGDIDTFDFTALVRFYEAERNASLGASYANAWRLMHKRLDAHLASSSTAALGGDLAYQYGMNGALSSMGSTSALQVLNDPNFGSQLQTLRPQTALQEGARLA